MTEGNNEIIGETEIPDPNTLFARRLDYFQERQTKDITSIKNILMFFLMIILIPMIIAACVFVWSGVHFFSGGY